MPEDIEDLGNEIPENNEQVFYLGDEQRNGKSFSIEKENVSPYDIFRHKESCWSRPFSL